MSEVVIIDAIRTPIGALGGLLASVRAGRPCGFGY